MLDCFNKFPVYLRVCNIFAKFTWKHLCRSLSFHKVAGCKLANLSKRDYNTDVFLWISRIISECLLYRTPEKSKIQNAYFTSDFSHMTGEPKEGLWTAKAFSVSSVSSCSLVLSLSWIQQISLHKKWSFALRISWVNVTKSAENWFNILSTVVNLSFSSQCSLLIPQKT